MLANTCFVVGGGTTESWQCVKTFSIRSENRRGGRL